MRHAQEVALNGAILARGVSGSATVAAQLVRAIEEQLGCEPRVLMPRWKRRRHSLVNAVLDTHWDFYGAPREARRSALFISPCNTGVGLRGQRHVLFVHDLMVFESPHLFDRKWVNYSRPAVRLSMAKATRILTTSRHTRRAVLQCVPSADVRIVRLPARSQSGPSAAWPAADKTVVMVGATEPWKNHAAGIRAVAALRDEQGGGVKLRLIGRPGAAERAVSSALREVDPRGEWSVREVHASDADVDAAYAGGWLLLQPSLNEGYGLPLLEAAQRGLPAVHSGAGAMNEVLPHSSAGGVSIDRLLSAMRALLSKDAWIDASHTSLDRAQTLSWASFSRDVADAVSDLL